jgi:hypothetical protein
MARQVAAQKQLALDSDFVVVEGELCDQLCQSSFTPL